MSRKVEAADERCKRLEKEAQEKREEVVRSDRATDELIRRNIELYGP